MLFIYLFLHFSMCRLGFFAIFFTEMCTATLQQWELEPTAPKAAIFWAGGGGICLEAGKTDFSWKA